MALLKGLRITCRFSSYFNIQRGVGSVGLFYSASGKNEKRINVWTADTKDSWWIICHHLSGQALFDRDAKSLISILRYHLWAWDSVDLCRGQLQEDYGHACTCSPLQEDTREVASSESPSASVYCKDCTVQTHQLMSWKLSGCQHIVHNLISPPLLRP